MHLSRQAKRELLHLSIQVCLGHWAHIAVVLRSHACTLARACCRYLLESVTLNGCILLLRLEEGLQRIDWPAVGTAHERHAE